MESAPGTSPDARVAASLARNDRYLHEFVEALALCPWARHCRELGRLGRTVLLEAGGPAGSESQGHLVHAALSALQEFAARPASELEIGLLIFPALAPCLREGHQGARGFEQFVVALREAMQRAFAATGPPFYCVAFHPEFGMDLADENRAVRFIRRSPDPTIQLVRISVLDAARGDAAGSTRYVDASRMTSEELMALQSPLSISEKITLGNFETLQREGPERLRALLEGMKSR